MELLDIKEFPSDILRKKCKKIEQVDKETRKLFNRMLYTMRYYDGVGLASPQIGLAKRIIVIEVGKQVLKLANPKIINKKGKDRMVEGCLSLPQTTVNVKRAEEVVVQTLNERGDKVRLNADGLLARVLQHEIDHLNGKLIVDYMNFFKRRRYIKQKSS